MLRLEVVPTTGVRIASVSLLEVAADHAYRAKCNDLIPLDARESFQATAIVDASLMERGMRAAW